MTDNLYLYLYFYFAFLCPSKCVWWAMTPLTLNLSDNQILVHIAPSSKLAVIEAFGWWVLGSNIYFLLLLLLVVRVPGNFPKTSWWRSPCCSWFFPTTPTWGFWEFRTLSFLWILFFMFFFHFLSISWQIYLEAVLICWLLQGSRPLFFNSGPGFENGVLQIFFWVFGDDH